MSKRKPGDEEYLTHEVKEAIVGAIVKSGIEEVPDIIKVLEELQNMGKKARKPFYDSVYGMVARGIGKRAPKRGITWALLDKAIAKEKVIRKTEEAEKSREQKMQAIKKRQERSRARSKVRLAKRKRASIAAKPTGKANKTQVVPKKKTASSPASPSKETLKIMHRARKNKDKIRQKMKSVLSHGKILKLLKSNGDEVKIISGLGAETGAASKGAGDEVEIEIEIEEEGDGTVPGENLEATKVTLQLGPGQLGIALNEIDATWCMVMSVVPNLQAEIAGFQEGDCITSIGGSHIPEGVNAIDSVTDLLRTVQRPCSVTVLREGKMVSKYPPVEVTVLFAKGGMGFSLEENSTGYCVLTDLVENGQAENLGLFQQDRIVQIGEVEIARGDNAYDDVLGLLQSTPKPFYMHVERDVREIRVSLHPGGLGMSLAEIDDVRCMISGMQDGGQADQVGLEEGDTIVSVGGNLIPKGMTAYDTVVSYLQNLPRPVELVALREGY